MIAAGYLPENVDVILLTHIHPDHSNGLISDSGKNKANVPAHNVPNINCPSAPMFQIFALKQKIKPRPIIIRGQAFTKISAILSGLENGEIKTWYNDSIIG